MATSAKRAQLGLSLETQSASSAMPPRPLWETSVKTAAATVLSATAQTSALPAKTELLYYPVVFARVKMASIWMLCQTHVRVAILHVQHA